ncbi:hypothetical protein D3C75_583000 [compost metagenome]
MDIVLSYNNFEESLILPVLPEDFSVPFNQRANEEFDLALGSGGIGKLNLPGLRGLKTISITTFFPSPRHQYSFVKSNVTSWDAINLINKWANSRNPIRLIVTHEDIEMLNTACLVESFTYGVDRSGDVPYTLELKEFVFLDGGG